MTNNKLVIAVLVEWSNERTLSNADVVDKGLFLRKLKNQLRSLFNEKHKCNPVITIEVYGEVEK